MLKFEEIPFVAQPKCQISSKNKEFDEVFTVRRKIGTYDLINRENKDILIEEFKKVINNIKYKKC